MHKANTTALLPQYVQSEEIMERFLETIHEENSSITRSPNSRGIKTVDGSELASDYLDYFNDNKTTLEDEFFEDLSKEIGEFKTELFCRIISKYWYDGRKKRNSRIVKGLKKSISEYLLAITSRTNLSGIVRNSSLSAYKICFTKNDISKILTVNDQNLHKHLAAWTETREKSGSISRSDIYFRRGISCNSLYQDDEEYIEWDYINSYSIAFSAPEQFSQMTRGKIPTILNADCDYFLGRVLFFSPFIKGMDNGQLEVGIIPGEKPDKLHYQGEHGGIHEFLIGDHPSLHI